MNKQTPEKVSIKPSGGLRVRKPNGQLLNPAGESVTWNAYWRRRELDQDIERIPTEVEPDPDPDPEPEADPDSPVTAKVRTKSATTPQSKTE